MFSTTVGGKDGVLRNKGYWLHLTLGVLSYISIIFCVVHEIIGFHVLSFAFSPQFGG
jgi:hypothetical protein